jgi:hypothetical protein
MKKTITTVITGVAALVALAAGLLGGTAVSALPRTNSSSATEPALKHMYETNLAGDSIGKFPDVWSTLEDLPDLIAAYDDAGQPGFVRRDDLFAAPDAEALVGMDSTGQSIAVYAADGRTVLGKLTFKATVDQE